MTTIAICSSADFYKQVNKIADELEYAGFGVLVPETAKKMRASGDYDVSHYKTWFGNANDYPKKARLMRAHFGEVDKADAILVVNNRKNGVDNYIGGNVLMEMAIAFFQNKPVYLWNGVPEDSKFLEEILGMQPIALKQNLDKLASDLK